MTPPDDGAPPSPIPRPALAALRGGAAPAGLGADLARVLALPDSARARFWEALGPSLSEPLPPSVEKVLDAFCGRHAAPRDDLARAVRGCRFLVREAARVALPASRLSDDLRALAGDDAPALEAVLLPGYEAAKGFLRKETGRASIEDHGPVLTDVRWRVDRVVSSERGAAGETVVAMLTLRYRDAGEERKLTVQATPETLRELQRMCDELLR